MFEMVFNSFLLVAATEMGDKTQLLAFILTSRFRKPGAILFGIFTATVLNHFLAATFGTWIAQMFAPNVLKWLLGAIFVGFALWILIPDKDDGLQSESRMGPYLTTVLAFFMAEMGDKTQLSTVALAAKYHNVALVTLGTTLGMMFSDGLAVYFGEKMTQKIPMKWVRPAVAILFVVFGLGIVIGL